MDPVQVANNRRETTTPRKKRTCRFYRQHGGCRKGEDCPFLHQGVESQMGSLNNNEVAAAAANEKRPNPRAHQKRRPRAMNKPNSSKIDETSSQISSIVVAEPSHSDSVKYADSNGSMPKIVHPSQVTTADRPVTTRPTRTSLTPSKEISFLERMREANEFSPCEPFSKNDSGELILPLSFRLVVVSSDPDFPYDMNRLYLEVAMPTGYPKDPCTVKVLNQDMPTFLSEYIERALNCAAKDFCGRCHVREMLKFADRNLEALIDQAAEAFKLSEERRVAGIEISVSAPAVKAATKVGDESRYAEGVLTNRPPAHSSKGSVGGTASDSEGAGSDTTNSSIEPGGGGSKAEPFGEIPASGTEIRLRDVNLKLEGIAVLAMLALRLEVSCLRCSTKTVTSFEPTATECGDSCSKCGEAFYLQLRRALVVAADKKARALGFLDIIGCKPVDVIYSQCTFRITCENCSNTLSVNDVSRDSPLVERCWTCHAKMVLELGGQRFVTIRSAGEIQKLIDKAMARRSKAKPNGPGGASGGGGGGGSQGSGVRKGQSLPDQGACKHYKKSHRWLRFPCCGRAFPCDVCHEEASDGHEMQWANRMICGYCSTEQPYSGNKPCNGCSKALAGNSRRTRFWEGGKGCRDTSKLSKNDPRKNRERHKKKTQKSKS
eukprot:Rmarinus@m.25519